MFPEGTRRRRVGTLIQHEVCRILERRMKDPRLGLVTITAVEVSADLKHAQVFVSSPGGSEESGKKVRVLERAASFIRTELAKSMELRYVPELRFLVDVSSERAARVNELLNLVARQRKEEPFEHDGS